MDELAAFSAGIVIVNAAAALIWMSWVAWHRMHGEHVNWWWRRSPLERRPRSRRSRIPQCPPPTAGPPGLLRNFNEPALLVAERSNKRHLAIQSMD